ncbi:MAG: acyl carrier protein [Methylobacteriaceae bacterium]|nr:acyl carrier protein [Methylobacteriaceae bacterium]
MDDQQILNELTDIFRDLFADDMIVLTPTTTAADIPGWDSIKHISLIVAVEQQFDIKMKTSEIERLANVEDLFATIRAKRS